MQVMGEDGLVVEKHIELSDKYGRVERTDSKLVVHGNLGLYVEPYVLLREYIAHTVENSNTRLSEQAKLNFESD